jgi:hypothetical protein
MIHGPLCPIASLSSARILFSKSNVPFGTHREKRDARKLSISVRQAMFIRFFSRDQAQNLMTHQRRAAHRIELALLGMAHITAWVGPP